MEKALYSGMSYGGKVMYNPTKNELKEATIDVLKKENDECTTKFINYQVAKKLNLSE